MTSTSVVASGIAAKQVSSLAGTTSWKYLSVARLIHKNASETGSRAAGSRCSATAMRPDDDDLFGACRTENLDIQIAAGCILDHVFLSRYVVASRLELGGDTVSGLRQLLRTVPQVPFANVHGQTGHMLAQLGSEREQGFVRRRQFAAKALSRHFIQDPPSITKKPHRSGCLP